MLVTYIDKVRQRICDQVAVVSVPNASIYIASHCLLTQSACGM